MHRSLKLCAFPLTGHGATTFACSAPQLTCVCMCVRVWSAHAPPLCHRPCIFFYPRDQRVSKTPSPNYFPREKNKDREKISRQDIINERTLEREREKKKKSKTSYHHNRRNFRSRNFLTLLASSLLRTHLDPPLRCEPKPAPIYKRIPSKNPSSPCPSSIHPPQKEFARERRTRRKGLGEVSRVTFTGCVRFYFPRKERVRAARHGSAVCVRVASARPMCWSGEQAAGAHTDVGKESVGYTHDVVAGPTTGARDRASVWWGMERSSGWWGKVSVSAPTGETADREGDTTKTGNEEQGNGEKE